MRDSAIIPAERASRMPDGSCQHGMLTPAAPKRHRSSQPFKSTPPNLDTRSFRRRTRQGSRGPSYGDLSGAHFKPLGATGPQTWNNKVVNMTQTHNTTINGATDPKVTTTMFGLAQDRINSSLLRNLQGVAQ